MKHKNEDIVASCTRELKELTPQEKEKSAARIQMMLDLTPLCSNFWNSNFQNVDCNQEAVRLFDLSNKQEYLDRFFDLSPEYQPDGELSSVKSPQMLKKAFEDGYHKFEWLHQKLNGEPIPTEITLIRAEYGAETMVLSYTNDLRKLKTTIAEKDEANKRIQILLDTTPLCIHILDENYNSLDCNQEALNLFNFPNKQAFLDSFHKLSPEYQPDGELSSKKHVQMLKKAFAEGHVKFKWLYQNLGGEPIPTEITLVRVEYKDKFIVVSYAHDLRELKALIAEKNKSNERIQIMLDSTPLCSNFWNSSLQNVDCNQEAVRLFDLSNKQEYLDRFFDLSPEYQPDGELSAEKAARLTNKTFEDGYNKFEWLHQKLNGELIPAEITLVRSNHDGEPIVLGYTNDLRKLKAAIAEKDTANERNKIMLDTTPLAANFIDGNFNCIDCNQEALRLFDLSNKEEYLTRFFDLSPEYQPDGELSSKKTPQLLSQAFEDGYAKFEWLHQKLNGEPIPTEITLIRVKQGNKFIVAGYVRDLREFKAMLKEMQGTEDELRQERNSAEKRAQVKSDFLANMSHEIRTPINAILGMTYLVLDSDLKETQRSFLEKAQYSAQLLLRIVNDVLDFSKIEAGHLAIDTIEFSLSEMLNNFLDIVKIQTSAKLLSLDMNIDSSVPDILVGDPLRLEQIIMNLVNNSIKFTEHGGLNINITRIAKNRDDHQLELLFEVADTGIGMTKSQVDILFNPFIQADTSITRKYGGTGLGLAICLSLANLMGGNIWCESEPGVGSKFSFTLLFSLCHATKITSEKTPEGITSEKIPEGESQAKLGHDEKALNEFSCLRGMHVLLAEDNEINQIVASELLIRKGVIVDTVNNGLEALEALENKDYDLVLMDIQMPEMDGLTATKKIRDNKKFEHLPIIAMTAHAMAGDREISISAGMNDHITKPIFPNKLYATLKKWYR